MDRRSYAWIVLLGRNGFLTRLLDAFGVHLPSIYGFTGMVLVFSLKFFPFAYLFISAALSRFDSSLDEAAEILGGSGMRKLITIAIPLILPSVSAAALMIFMTATADFGTPMLIGEGYKVLPVLIYEEYVSETGGNAPMASALSVIMILLTLTLLLAQKMATERRDTFMQRITPPVRKPLKKFPKLLISGSVFSVCSLALLPQITVIVTSFIKTRGPVFINGFSLDSYRSVFFLISECIVNTAIYSIVAVSIMVLASVLISYILVRRKSFVTSLLDVLIMVPYVIPGAVLGLCLLVAFNQRPLFLSGTATIMILAYVIRKLPFTLRSCVA
ncbi:MAG: iron ABC transporter permease, partial [Chitinivibrionales bacterium]|nr:iron ABC transporter permease [Chitinivibrionales bacterium]